jgi:hypothetical protein
VVFCLLALERPGLGAETVARRWREHSTCCAVVMARISPRWWYNLSTSSVEGAGNVSRSMVAVTTFCLDLAKVGRYPPFWLMVGVTPLP